MKIYEELSKIHSNNKTPAHDQEVMKNVTIVTL